MAHTLVKAVIASHVIELIAEKYKLSIEGATDLFYMSDTIKLLSDDETGLYGESFLYVFSLFVEEMNTKKMIDK